MKKVILVATLVIGFAASAFAADKNGYQYDKYNHNGSHQDRMTPSDQKAMEKKTYNTQNKINDALSTMNKGKTTSAPGKYDTKVYDGGRGAKTVER